MTPGADGGRGWAGDRTASGSQKKSTQACPDEALAAWDAAIRPLLGGGRLLVALDFDGTLAPLVAAPAEARPLPAASAALGRLAALDRVVLALVSGRPARDLVELAGPPEGTRLIGSHGAEQGAVEGGRAVIKPVALSPRRLARLAAVRQAFEALAATAEGAWVEAKPFAAVFHTRPMPHRTFAMALEERAAELATSLGAHVLPGKMVVEAAVLPAGKAAALARLRRQADAQRLVFAGDDVTDELALRTIKPPDLGIKVGPGATAAGLRLAGPPQVAAFLDCLATALAGVAGAGSDAGSDAGSGAGAGAGAGAGQAAPAPSSVRRRA
ncbi:MAG: trehalose-phosphatase [Bifidobacteriaceae bacterium]|nr:trehalose-phosphatase [Bifidobacteriaceae bacterium]